MSQVKVSHHPRSNGVPASWAWSLLAFAFLAEIVLGVGRNLGVAVSFSIVSGILCSISIVYVVFSSSAKSLSAVIAEDRSAVGMMLILSILIVQALTSNQLVELTYFLRGLFLFFAFAILGRLTPNNDPITARKWALRMLGLFLTLILLHAVMGIGGVETAGGKERPGFTSFFYRGNQVAVVATLLYLYVMGTAKSSFFCSATYFLGLGSMLLFNSVSGFIALFLCGLLLLPRNFKWLLSLSSVALIFFTLASNEFQSVGAGFFQSSRVADALSDFRTKGALEGFLTLYGQRGLSVSSAMACLAERDVISMLLGASKHVIEACVASSSPLALNARAVENDLVELLATIGLAGAVITFAEFLPATATIWKQVLTTTTPKDYCRQTLTYALMGLAGLLFAATTGHTFTSPLSASLLGLAIGRHRALLEKR